MDESLCKSQIFNSGLLNQNIIDVLLMTKIAFLLITTIIVLTVDTKSVEKVVKLANFNKEGPFIFFTKLHIGKGYGQVDVSYRKSDQIASQRFYNDLSIGIINQTSYSTFSKQASCLQKEKLFYKTQKFNFKQETYGSKSIKFHQIQTQELWYFYIYSCINNLDQLSKSNEQIKFSLAALNNGSHFGQNQQTLYAYVAILIIWTVLIIKFSMPMGSLLSVNNPSLLKMTIFGGLIVLGAAYLYRLIHLVLYNIDGNGIYVFQILYLVLKNIGEAIVTTVIVSVAWGWSIVHLNTNQSYIIIGVLTGIVNIVSIILSSLTQQHEELFHHYDTIPGGIVLILRIILFFVFIIGITKSLKQTGGKTAYFIRKLGLIGGTYLLSWPLTVLIVQFTFPNYMHRQIITFVEQTVHICACTLICQMISNPESSYRKISLHDDDNPLHMTDYRKK